MSGASGAHGVQIQRELERIMKRYAPEKLANVDKLMATHHNREEELLRKVGDCRVAEFRARHWGGVCGAGRGWARLYSHPSSAHTFAPSCTIACGLVCPSPRRTRPFHPLILPPLLQPSPYRS